MDSKIEQVKKILELGKVPTKQVICPKPEQMMICPKAEKCPLSCQSKEPHELKESCKWEGVNCPACIPVPSTPASEHIGDVTEMIAQHGTNVAPSTPSSVPLPPDELLTDEEKINITNDICKKNNTSWDEVWELPKLKTELIAIECYEAVAKAQLLKCHQSEAAEIASLQADIEELNILSRGNSEVYDTRIKELEEQNEQLRIGELVIVTEQKQKEQIIAETKAPLMAKIKELEVKTGSCRGCDQFFSTQISEAKAEARREAQEVYMPKFTSEEILGHIEVLSKSFYDKYAGKGLTPSEVMELHKSEYWELVINFIEAPLREEIAELKAKIERLEGK